MPLLEKLLGSTLVSRRGEVATEQALERKHVVGLYFTASTCHPCQAFTPILATVHRNMALAAYRHLRMQEQMDVVLVSMDRDEFAFRDYLLQTPFLAVPFRRREVAQDLWKRYDVKKIPTLIFVNENGEEIERDGRRFVENHYMDLNKIWQRLDMASHPQQNPIDDVAMPSQQAHERQAVAVHSIHLILIFQLTSFTASLSLQVLHDLIHERGLIDWRVVTRSADSYTAADAAIYGRVNADRFDESRALRKRKPLMRSGESSAAPLVGEEAEPIAATWCCFLVLATSFSGGQLSIQRLVEMQQAAVASAPEGLPHCERTFLCLTDAANVRSRESHEHERTRRPTSPHPHSPPPQHQHHHLISMLAQCALATRRVTSCLTRSVTTIGGLPPQSASSSKDPPAERKLPLEGVRVIECGHLIAGPFAGTILSYFGADVIKIEPPTGDQVRDYRELDATKTSLWWYSLGRNKRSVSVDIKSERGRALIRELVNTSDVVIENFKPGRMEKWGLGPDSFEAVNPGLVYARVSGFGQDGPYSSRPGFASVCEAMGGFRYVNGFPDRPPVRQNLSLGDTIAGIHTALGIVIALLGRERSATTPARGQVVDIAIYETMFNLMEAVVPEYDYAGVVRECSGSTITGIVPSNTYTTVDKKNIVIAANTDTLFVKLMNAIGQHGMAGDAKYRTNADRVKFQQEIDDAVAQWTAIQPLETVVEVMEAHQVPVGLVYSVEDMLKDEHFNHREMFEEVQIDGDEQRTLKIPAIVPKLKGTPGRTLWAGRKLGQDTRQVLRDELKRSESDIEALLKDKIVFEPKK